MPGAQISKERQERRDFYSQTRDWMFSSVMKARVCWNQAPRAFMLSELRLLTDALPRIS